MSVQPYTSPYDPSPIGTGSTADPAGAGRPASGGATIPAGSAVPDLYMDFTTAPDFEPVQLPPGPASSTPPPALPPGIDMGMDFGSLRAAEDAMITACTGIVTGYEFLKNLYEQNKDTVFGQQATTTIKAPETPSAPVQGMGGLTKTAHDTQPGPNGDPARGPINLPDPIQVMAKGFANGQDGVPGMNDVEAYALQSIGNAMGLVGSFMAMINAAGYIYAQADASSVLPPPQIPAAS